MTDEHEAIWATEGLFVIADAIKAKRGDDDLIVNDKGMPEFVCPIFTMRSYSEAGYDAEEPNFVFHPAGFQIVWYKYVGRGQVGNRPKPPGMMWESAVADCIKAVAAWVP